MQCFFACIPDKPVPACGSEPVRERTANFRKFPALVAPVNLKVPTLVLGARKLGWLGNKYTHKNIEQECERHLIPTQMQLFVLS